ncbi:alpha/beta hydrolase fold domain-containing protein [Rathayibacter sp. VKM Ac-2803]|uniref:alpha/beta hydrolase n=1 Tax=Rathayibacter sp. VKM Ac-2803 TaxID=2609256 RepID=UPI0013583BC5|nr:alpha/beta hydrolase [Rathayibacter sp. VKM Ac-2803]MWV51052.1 alpha/beta hydrolase fold domain-containing protein [Rathayibacter sp. VKM Ac-2803]
MREPLRPTRSFALSAAILALTAGLLAGCSSAPVSEPIAQAPGAAPVAAYPDVPVEADLVYDEATGQALDVCSPVDAGASPLPAVLVVHGGSWARGDKADVNWRPLCQWLASEGFVAVSVNYRLAPDAVFPAQIDDVSAALDWILDPAQTERFGIDPDRVAAFGGSAGGNLVSLLGTRESTSSRLAAVVDLSGPSDLTAAGLADDDPVVGVAGAVRTYLDCADLAACPAAAEASPLAHVDGTEPAFLIAHSAEERIALSQSSAFADALDAAGASVDFVVVPGAAHSIAMLDESLRGTIVEFLHAQLDAPAEQTLSLDAGVTDPES